MSCTARSRDDTVLRALASHRCGPGSIPGVGARCKQSLLFYLVPAPRYISTDSSRKHRTKSHSVDVSLKLPLILFSTSIRFHDTVYLFFHPSIENIGGRAGGVIEFAKSGGGGGGGFSVFQREGGELLASRRNKKAKELPSGRCSLCNPPAGDHCRFIQILIPLLMFRSSN